MGKKKSADAKLPARITTPPRSAYSRLRTDLKRKDRNIVGCFIGQKRVGSRYRKGVCLTVLVKRKVADHLLPDIKRIPRSVAFARVDGSRVKATINTDVIEWVSSKASLAELVLGPGDGVVEQMGTIGAVIQHPRFGKVLTTAGHVVYKRKGAWEWTDLGYPVELALSGSGQAVAGEVLRSVCTSTCDYAFLRPLDDTRLDNLYLDQYPIAAPRELSEFDIGRPVWVLSRSGHTQTVLRGFGGSLPIGVAGSMHGLILTDWASEAGDSGALLIDERWHALGFLVGTYANPDVSYSVFMRAAVPLEGEASWG